MYHFVGIKGAGMSSLAQIMYELGYEVNGSDVEKHFFTEEGLIKRNIQITPYDSTNIKEGMKIVRGASIKDDNPEIIKAIELDLPIYTYQELLGKLTKKFKSICVAGCHGKTTTTAMLSHVLNEIKGVNYLIGDGTGFAKEGNEYFVLESCEYQRHFLNYTPYYAVITNIDLDHVDYYKDIDDVINAYQEFANKAEKMVIACGDDPYTHSLEINPPIFYYGLDDDNDIRAINVNYKETGTSFEVEVEGNYYGFFDLPIYGKHMLLDALAVISICYYERIESKEVNKIFKTFIGAKRRFQETIINDNIVIDDYAHHPNEIKATIKAIKQKYPNKKIVAIFQPHTFTRTQEFATDIATSLNLVDKAFVLDIHPAREKAEDYPLITSDIIIKELNNGEHINIDEADKLYKEKDAVYIFMSPNDISKLENELIEKLKPID
ncbi:MAG: UDP-N-acetylmuramate--L-alanine ligase [Bacilli bacterium]|nr:UDP-N-acetylmuramate--L-alanine ligase [Bacilli bacterium]